MPLGARHDGDADFLDAYKHDVPARVEFCEGRRSETPAALRALEAIPLELVIVQGPTAVRQLVGNCGDTDEGISEAVGSS